MLFKDKIKAEVNLEGFTAEEKAELIEKLEENIIVKVNLVLMEKLTVKDREEFFKLSEHSYTPATSEFLEKRIPHAAKLIANAADEVIAEFNKLREE